MLTREQIWDYGHSTGEGFDGRTRWILCLVCGSTLHSCPDPACEDEMHHYESLTASYWCPLGFSVFYADRHNYIELTYADEDEAQAEADAYHAYQRWAQDYFGRTR